MKFNQVRLVVIGTIWLVVGLIPRQDMALVCDGLVLIGIYICLEKD